MMSEAYDMWRHRVIEPSWYKFSEAEVKSEEAHLS